MGATHTKVHLLDVTDAAGKHGVEGMQARFARSNLAAQRSGVTHFRLDPGFRVPWGHRHRIEEETYVVLAGSLTVRVEDEEVQLGPLDAIRIEPTAARNFQAGPEGAELLAFGAREGESDAEQLMGWWG
jgi:mannose-6-phosphate isomerase-like protein (cupin superfamily)